MDPPVIHLYLASLISWSCESQEGKTAPTNRRVSRASLREEAEVLWGRFSDVPGGTHQIHKIQKVIPARDPKQCKNEMHCMCDHSMWALYVWPLYVSTLCVTTLCDRSMWAPYVSILYVSTLCEHSMCEHSMCDHSMWALYMWALYMWALYVWALYMWALYMWALYVWALYVWALYMWALYAWPLYVSTPCVSTLCVSTLCVTTLWEHPMCEHSMWAPHHHHKNITIKTPPHHHTIRKFTDETRPTPVRHLDLDTPAFYHYRENPSVTTLFGEQHKNTTTKSTSVLGPEVAERRKVREWPCKLDFSSWAGCCGTPKSTKITTKTRLQFLGRMLQRQKRQKNTSFIVKTPFKSIAEHRKVWELRRKMNIEEVEEPKKYENLQTKPVLDPFKIFQEHRRHTKSTRITTKNEHQRSWRTGNYENLQTKAAPVGRGHPETTKIHRRNEHASTKPRK